MYKRKARIVFWCAEHAGYGLIAAVLANRLGEGWLEARAAGRDGAGLPPAAVAVLHERGIDTIDQVSHRPSDALFAWSDLVVTLGADATGPVLPPHVQKKHWPLPRAPVASEDADAIARAFRAARDDIEVRIAGMLGGMRLLAKSDRPGDAPE